jgi:hypothetical protein
MLRYRYVNIPYKLTCGGPFFFNNWEMAQTAPSVPNQAFVTLATNDDYVRGALVLGHSLQIAGTSRTLVVMVTADVSQEQR